MARTIACVKTEHELRRFSATFQVKKVSRHSSLKQKIEKTSRAQKMTLSNYQKFLFPVENFGPIFERRTTNEKEEISDESLRKLQQPKM